MMAVTVADMQADFLEFADVDSGVIADRLAAAEDEVGSAAYPTTTRDTVVKLLTADKLARTPHGAMSGLVTSDGRTIYQAEYERLEKKYGTGYRVMPGVTS